jgi:flagellar biosynthesis protein FlhB
MSDDHDPESKTEEATEKKVQDTLEKGNRPMSRDAVSVAGFFSFLLCLNYVFPSVGPRMIEAMSMMLGSSAGIPLHNGADAASYMIAVLLELARFLAPLLALITFGGLAASFAQGAPRFVFDRIQPDLSRLSLRSGWRRIFGVAGLVELAKAVAKMTIVGGAAGFALVVDHGAITDAMRTEPGQLPKLASSVIIHLTSVVCIAASLLAFADVAWTRVKWRRDIRMSRQDHKDEVKQAEGDPVVKGRMRSLALHRSRKRMMAAVPNATLVIANPTHYAIALRYIREEGGAPLVVAKGKDLLALKIREIAERENIPVLEKKELARAMYDLVEVDRMIPQEFFRPIAELIHFLGQADARPRR